MNTKQRECHLKSALMTNHNTFGGFPRNRTVGGMECLPLHWSISTNCHKNKCSKSFLFGFVISAFFLYGQNNFTLASFKCDFKLSPVLILT